MPGSPEGRVQSERESVLIWERERRSPQTLLSIRLKAKESTVPIWVVRSFSKNYSIEEPLN